MLAHGIGSRTDLPIPLGLALYGAGAAVLISFAALLLLWRTPRLTPGPGVPVPVRVQRVLDAPATRTTVQAVFLALACLITVVATAGPADIPVNLAPWALYITFWVGLVPVSLLLGPVWRVANPLRLLHRGLRVLAGPPVAPQILGRVGLWPAAVALTVFVWLELVYPERAEPRTVALFLVAYAVLQVFAALLFGEEWFARGDGFEVYSTLLGRLSPLARRGDGRLVLRVPMVNAAAAPEQPGLAAVVVVLLGSTAFDGLSRTVYWQTGPGRANDTLSGTLGIAVMIAAVGALYVLGTRLTAKLGSLDPRPQPRRYAHTVVPIVVGYTVAHYFSLFMIDGQTTWILLSNPFRQDGVDLFGTYDQVVNYAAVSADTIAYVQVGAVVLGHVAGVVLAHEQALRAAVRARGSDQLPLVAVMVVFTIGGLGLLFGF